jgi:ParD-like antitoxin of type II bacterial toxin-antitoxin system
MSFKNISDALAQKAKQRSRVMHSSVVGQIEYWAQMGEILEDNPDLSFQFVQDS